MSDKSTFWRDSAGRIVVTQRPNWPVWGILGLMVLGRLLPEQGSRISVGIGALIMYWGYGEVHSGVNGFRRLLGVIGIGYAILRLIQ